jgi:hypothetical protein
MARCFVVAIVDKLTRVEIQLVRPILVFTTRVECYEFLVFTASSGAKAAQITDTEQQFGQGFNRKVATLPSLIYGVNNQISLRQILISNHPDHNLRLRQVTNPIALGDCRIELTLSIKLNYELRIRTIRTMLTRF